MIWLYVAIAIIVVAAALLIWILLEAKGIRHQAGRVLAAAGDVQQRSTALCAIPEVTNGLDVGLEAIDGIAENAITLRDALSGGEAKS